ncbi:hypothetical protein C8Q73DRAFT_88452 [Cubamyces lactineus]|nr:hypothetical protein C8Q73DRAFT_88452 [Cubamyces lactineus]
MHRALNIPEILRYICEYADDDTLATMARCARFLHDPVISVLWSVLSDLGPVIMCFPEDAWSLDGQNGLHVNRPLNHSDWARVLKYLPYVRQLGVAPSQVDYELKYDAWEAICTFRPTIVLFPNLRTIYWSPLRLLDRQMPHLLAMIGERLTKLDIGRVQHRADTNAALQAAFHIIKERFPHIRQFYVGRPNETAVWADDGTIESLSILACSLSSLASFCSTEIPLAQGALYSLARSKRLTWLCICLPSDATWAQVHVALQGERLFENLTGLELVTTTEAYIAFSAAMKLPHVRSLSLCLSDPSHPNLFATFFTAIRHQFSPAALRSLRILHSRNIGSLPWPSQALLTPIIHSAYLAPLLGFKRLRSFDLRLRSRYALDIHFYLNLAKSWSEIEELFVAYERGCWHDMVPTIQFLVTFAVHSPKLRHLGLCFDASLWSHPPELLAGGDNGTDADAREQLFGELANKPSTSQLNTLAVGYSNVVQPSYVAAFLSRVFPSLSSVETGDSPDHFNQYAKAEQWRMVNELLPLFRKSREDGQREHSQRTHASKEVASPDGSRSPSPSVEEAWAR